VALTELGIRKLRPPKTGRIERYDGGVRGFGVRVTDRGVKTYVFLYMHGGRRRRYTIGRIAEIELDAARAKAAELRLQVRQGRDPAAEEKVTRAVAVAAGAPKTFKEVADLYEKRVLAHTRRGDEVRQTIDLHMLPVWGGLPITAVTSQDIVNLVEAKIDAGHPAGARRVLEIAQRVFRWATTRPELKLERSPGEKLSPKSISSSLERVERDRTLSDPEWRALHRAVQRLEYPFGPFVHMLMLTALRRQEVSHARWSELDLTDKRWWTIPKERMKGDRVHIVPLTKQMVALIDALPRNGEFLFSSRNVSQPLAGYSTLKARLDRLMLEEIQREDKDVTEIAHWTFHDIRRSIRTQMSMLPIPEGDIVRESILAHVRPSLHRTYDKYKYLDERRRAYELWQGKLTSIIERRSADVIKMQDRA
jgi:integrase